MLSIIRNLTAGQFLIAFALVFVAIVIVGFALGFAGLYVAMNIVMIAGMPTVLLGLLGVAIAMNR